MNGNTTHFEVTAKAWEPVHIDGTPIPIKIVNSLCHIPNVTKDGSISRGIDGKVAGLVHTLLDTDQVVRYPLEGVGVRSSQHDRVGQ